MFWKTLKMMLVGAVWLKAALKLPLMSVTTDAGLVTSWLIV